MKLVSLLIALVWFGLAPLAVAAAEGPAPAVATNVTHVNASQAAKLLATNQPVIIDVRTRAEFDKACIAGARLVDITRPDFEQQLEQLDRSQTYLVLCQSGGRSIRALKSFNKLGFKSIIHLDGGMNAWIKAGQTVQQ
jgi:phage shock protein E